MRILDRYILNSMVKIFISCIMIVLMLSVIIDLFSHLDEILKQRTSIELLFMYYLNFLPFIFVQVSPFACLFGCLYTLGVLNRNNEIIAMREVKNTIILDLTVQAGLTLILFKWLNLWIKKLFNNCVFKYWFINIPDFIELNFTYINWIKYNF